MWVKHSDFKEVVEQSWNQPLEGYGMFLLAQKLKWLKKVLSDWSKSVFGNVFENIARAEEEVLQQELWLEEEDNEATQMQWSQARANC